MAELEHVKAPAPRVRVVAEDLGLRAGPGWVYRHVTLRAGRGDLVALVGPGGSGRTSLLLTLAGRMRFDEGRVRLDDLELPRAAAQAQRRVGLGELAGVNGLDPLLTVGEHVRERLLLSTRRRSRAEVARVLEVAWMNVDPRARVRDLAPADRVLVGAALGLVDNPLVLLVDDVDAGVPPEDRRRVWQTLRAIADAGTTVVGTCVDAREGAGLLDVLARLEPEAKEPVRRPGTLARLAGVARRLPPRGSAKRGLPPGTPLGRPPALAKRERIPTTRERRLDPGPPLEGDPFERDPIEPDQ